MCPDWESTGRPLRSQAGAQSTEPHQPRQESEFLTINRYILVSPNVDFYKEDLQRIVFITHKITKPEKFSKSNKFEF